MFHSTENKGIIEWTLQKNISSPSLPFAFVWNKPLVQHDHQKKRDSREMRKYRKNAQIQAQTARKNKGLGSPFIASYFAVAKSPRALCYTKM